MSGHTPGPWVIPADKGAECVICAGGTPSRPGRILFVLRDPVGVSARYLLSNAELNADARLCAAAPEMLDALTQAEACMSIVEPRNSKAEYLRILGVVREAIAKAEGASIAFTSDQPEKVPHE